TAATTGVIPNRRTRSTRPSPTCRSRAPRPSSPSGQRCGTPSRHGTPHDGDAQAGWIQTRVVDRGVRREACALVEVASTGVEVAIEAGEIRARHVDVDAVVR